MYELLGELFGEELRCGCWEYFIPYHDDDGYEIIGKMIEVIDHDDDCDDCLQRSFRLFTLERDTVVKSEDISIDAVIQQISYYIN